MDWRRRGGSAALLLSGNLLFPAVAWAVGRFAELPADNSIDWQGQSLPARALGALLVAHLSYALALVAVMRGLRVLALTVAVPSFGVSLVVNTWAWLKVTGVFL